ncbi:MAG: hypothetical protein RR380_07465, partial [Gordonibacter sp.]
RETVPSRIFLQAYGLNAVRYAEGGINSLTSVSEILAQVKNGEAAFLGRSPSVWANLQINQLQLLVGCLRTV